MTENKKIPNVIFILGPPGAGKGTQSELILNHFEKQKIDHKYLCAGQLLREERKKENSKVGQLIEDICLAGKIVPSEITYGLLEKEIVGHDKNNEESCSTTFLIDGYPRNQENLDIWIANMEQTGKSQIKKVLFYEVNEETCVTRLVKRSETSGRSDDNLASIKKRFQTYYEVTNPVLKYFADRNLLVKIDGSGSDPQQIFDETLSHL